MKKFLGVFLAFFLFYFLTSPVHAFDSSKPVGVLNLPDEAKTKDVVSLGHFKDPKTGRDVQGYAFIHRGSGKNKSLAPSALGNSQPISDTASASPVTNSVLSPCFGYTPGVFWKSLGSPWVINPKNSRGLTSQFLLNTEGADIAKWEDASDGTVGDGKSINILGSGSITNAQLTGVYNGQNEVFFGQSSIPNAVAVTIAWGYFDGELSDRRIIEWEQIFNDVDYDWSANGEVDKYDFEEISTHELGHVFGLTDQYDSACSGATMFGYTAPGETNKRSLEAPDVTGVKELYRTDNDLDGCPDVKELGTDWHFGGQRDPGNKWDFFDVPVPAITAANAALPVGDPNRPKFNKAISLADVSSVLFYVGAVKGRGANANGVSYDTHYGYQMGLTSDPNFTDGMFYDRTPSTDSTRSWRSGAANGAVSLQDVGVALTQVGTNCN